MKSSNRIILAVFAALCLFSGIYLYLKLFGSGVPNDLDSYYVEIPTGSNFEEVVTILKDQEIIEDEVIFRQLADRMKYKRDPMRSGRYEIKSGWSHIQLIRHLRNGAQAPVDVVLTNERLMEEIAGKVARFIEPDSVAILTLLNDEAYIRSLGYTPETLMSLFIPNTYEFFWNSTPQQFVERMAKEHDAFWSKNDRLAKAAAKNMTPEAIYTLASIVEKETNQNAEKPRIAGVYLNRLETGMRLQADPTVVFATREFDLKRVLNRHLAFDSPYNTYLYAGLPPGPISMASISSIDAVLNAEDHDYIFFCAKGDGSGLHAFAETLAGHNQNVVRYVANLRERGLR